MHKLEDKKIKKIAIFRALQLGDLLCAIPAIRVLKHACPQAEITLLGLSWAENFVKRFSGYFSGFIRFPGYPGLREQSFHLKNFIAFLHDVNKEQFDLLIQMHGNGSIINPMIGMLGAKRTAGYFEAGKYCPDKELFMAYPEDHSEIKKHLSLMNFFGFPSGEYQLEFPVLQGEQKHFKELCKIIGIKSKEYVCVHPGARDTKRMWHPKKFALVADKIAEKGYKIVLTGTEMERHAVELVEKYMRYEAINCVGKTDMGTLALLIKNSKMLFSNDTGVSHIASAVKTPSVLIFLASDPKRWAPLNKNLHRVILPEESENLDFVLSNTAQVLRE